MNLEDLTDNRLCIRTNFKVTKENIYIYGTDKNSVKLFFQLASLRIRIKGFVEKEYSKIDTFYHKPIYTINELQKDDILLTTNEENDLKNCVLCKNLVEFNRNINCNKIVIYGCGAVGRKLKKYLDTIGVHVKCYIETDSNKIGTLLDGIPVYGRDKLVTFQDDVSVIAAGQYWQEIDDIIQKTNDKLERYYIPYGSLIDLLNMTLEEGIIVDFEQNAKIRCYAVFSLEEHYEDKELILYGSDMYLMKEYAEIYTLLDFKKVTIAIDDEKIVAKEFQYSVINIVEVLYRNKFIILLCDKLKIKNLDDLGLMASRDYVMISSAEPANPYREISLDINLGYVYLTNTLYPGIHIYGENKQDDFKIVVLGGSTSESDRSFIKPWVEFLYDSYLGKGITLYNCAASGYSSGQELLKLMRDAILLHPDLIISYSGANEVTQVKGNSVFAFNYLYSVFDAIASSSKMKLVTGVTNEENCYSKWLTNIKYMNAIAEINEAKFYAFIQPVLSNKDVLTMHEKKMMMMMATIYNDKIFEEYKLFRKKAGEMKEKYSYIYDLTSIFDKEDVYMDFCHVYEKGNEIIANSIWNIIRENVSRI